MPTTIIPGPDTDVPALARTLLDAADSPDDVRTDTSGNTTAFVISDDLAERLGYTEQTAVDDAVDGAGHVDVNGSTESGDPTAPAEAPVEPTDVDPENPTVGEKPPVDEPPRGGKGSGGDEWFAFLQEQEVEIPEDVTAEDRTELIALWDAHKASTQG